ncbi:hypothetical protein PSYAE_13265 [Pseudomonas amygdali pv. aesculi str. 0893_23]|nr:hypothetical protein PSYAE_13265 [Pseudomonas amygdali pv. aesculi str. 0893_23]
MAQKRKLLYWESSSKKDFKEFPIDVQKDMGVALFIVQLGSTPPSAKLWKGLGSGVYELVEDHRSDTFRAVYTVTMGDSDNGRCGTCNTCVPEKVQVRHRHAAAGRGTDREAVEGHTGPS